MWGFFKIFIVTLLLVFVFVSFGYVFINRWMVKCIDSRLEGEDREAPDIVMVTEPAVASEKAVHPLVARHLARKKQDEKVKDKDDQDESEDESDDLEAGYISD